MNAEAEQGAVRDLRSITVVIPLFNKRAEVQRSVQSALNQTLPPAEVIVIDDGSTDGSADVVAGLESSLVRLIRKENEGVSAARNLGVQEAKSTHVAFLDADDIWSANHLETLSVLMQTVPSVRFLSTAHRIQEAGRVVTPNTTFPLGWRGGVSNFLSAYAASPFILNASTTWVER